MKQGVIVLILTVIIICNAFGLGQIDKGNKIIEIEDTAEPGQVENRLGFTEQHDLGTSTINIIPMTEVSKYKFVLVRIGDEFYNPNTGKYIDRTLYETIINQTSTNSLKDITIVSPDKEDEDEQLEAEYGTGSIAISQQDTEILGQVAVNGEITILLDKYIEDEIIGIIGIKENEDGTYTYEYITCNTDISFFKNEKEILKHGISGDELTSKSEDEKYLIRALAFMSSFFTGEELGIFKTIVNTYMSINLDDYSSFQFEAGKENEIKSQFQKVFNSHIRFRYEEENIFKEKSMRVPFLDLDKETFKYIYGDPSSAGTEQYKKRNPYIFSYFLYCYYEDENKPAKPVLSNLIEEESKKVDIYYDYAQLQTISEDEGVELGKAVLKYLNWGVEYTPYPGGSSIDVGYSGNPVFSKNKDKIDEWIGELNIDNRTSENNYFPYDIEPAPVFSIPEDEDTPQKIHILEGDFTSKKYTTVGHLTDENENMEISKIDLWTGKNIAWIPGRVSNISIVPEPTNPPERLIDKKIFLDNENEKKNVHIVREGSNAIEIRCEFANPEKIGGLIVVRGRGINKEKSKDNFALDEGNGGKKFQIKYRKMYGVMEDLINENNANYGEYVFYYTGNDKVTKIGNRSAYPGYAFTRGNYIVDDNNIDVTYIYIVFPEPLTNCKELVIQDKSVNEFLNISELMIFDNNPIKYITDYMGDKKDVYAREIIKNINIEDNSSIWKVKTGSGVNNSRRRFSSTDERLRFLLLNGHPPRFLDIKNTANKEADWIDILLNDTAQVQQIVVWEPNASGNAAVQQFPDSEIFKKELFVLLDHNSELKRSITFTTEQEIQSLNELYNTGWFTTPFMHTTEEVIDGETISVETPVSGNPLPYAPKGIDSPRTFAYKMNEQRKARNWFKINVDDQYRVYTEERFPLSEFTTIGENAQGVNEYSRAYVSEIDLFSIYNFNLGIDPTNYCFTIYPDPASYLRYTNNKMMKPFLPGLMLNTSNGYIETWDSMYNANKIGGVDSLGMLMGALSMSGIDSDNRFLNVFNVHMRKMVDGFYKMQQGSVGTIELKGMDTEGKPVFHTPEDESYLNPDSPYRFTRQDLERCTVLVPDIRCARVGDLIVKTGYDRDPHMGIIVKTPWDSGTTVDEDTELEELMSNIYLVTVRRGHRMALLCRWGNTENVFGGFTENPEEYHIRRLLKLPEGNNMTDYHDVDEWELVELMLEALDCNLILPTDPYNTGHKNHWIPNTMVILNNETIPEKLDGIQVKIRGITIAGANTVIPEGKNDIWFAVPDDPFFNKDVRKNGNIQCNKGGGIEIFAQFNDGENKEYTLLARFERNTSVDTMEDPGLKDYYNIVENDALFESNGMGKEGVRLYCEGENLTFMDEDGNKTDRFAISAIDPVKPGDDFQLRFCIAYDHEVTGMVWPGDFVACYDKKLLWRANLFIDENYDRVTQTYLPDAMDWNNINPWNVETNAWKMYKDYFSDPTKDAADVPVVDSEGRQMRILPWTHPSTGNVNYNVEKKQIFSAVPYDYIGGDSVYSFHKNLHIQSKALQDKNTVNEDFPTFAPGDDWFSYLESTYIPALGMYNHGKSDDEKRAGKKLGINCTGLMLKAKNYVSRSGSWEIDNYKFLVPGDLIHFVGHWAIINKIEYPDPEKRETTDARIFCIHATPWGGYWFVRTNQPYSELAGELELRAFKRGK